MPVSVLGTEATVVNKRHGVPILIKKRNVVIQQEKVMISVTLSSVKIISELRQEMTRKGKLPGESFQGGTFELRS